MNVGPAGAGALPVDLQGGFIGLVAQGGLELLILGKPDAKLTVHSVLVLGADGDLHVHDPAFNAGQSHIALHRHVLVFNLIASVLIQFPDGPLVKTSVLNGQFPGQGHLSEPLTLLSTLLVAGIPVLHPGDHDPPSVGSQGGLGSVEIDTIVHRLMMFIGEMLPFSIHLADEAKGTVAIVVLKSLGEHILGTAEQNMLSVQFEEIRALPHEAKAAVIADQDTFILPVEAIGTAEQDDCAFLLRNPGTDHTAVGAVRFPPDLGIPEVIAAHALGQVGSIQHRIMRILLIIQAVAHSDTLGLDILAVVAALFQNTGVHEKLFSVRKFNGAAGKHAVRIVGLIGSHGTGQVFPVQQIITDYMPPMHGVPHGLIGVVLIEQVILVLVKRKAIGVVGPAHAGGHMESGPGLGRNLGTALLLIGPGKQKLLIDHKLSPFVSLTDSPLPWSLKIFSRVMLQVSPITAGTIDTNPGTIHITNIPAAVGKNTVNARSGCRSISTAEPLSTSFAPPWNLAQ